MTQIARVALDQPLPHLDRLFDYEVPETLSERARVGARVKVRFAGRKLDGWITELTAESSVAKLSRIESVVSPEEILRPELVRLIRAVADHYAGTFSDVMRLAIPPRHARTEAAVQQPWPTPACDQPAAVLSGYPAGRGFLEALADGGLPRAFWQVAPVADTPGDWAAGFADATAATLQSGRSSLVLVPNERELAHCYRVFSETFGKRTVAVLHAGLGPSARYRNYLAAARGVAKILIGTRAAAFAPMSDLGLIAMWDDGDDSFSDRHAPYPHAREVAAIRIAQQRTAALFASHARTAEIQRWLQRGWLSPVELTPAGQRAISPAVKIAGDSDIELERDRLARQVRLPNQAFALLRRGLAQGPVLVQVPRTGYAVSLACDQCREPARCPVCTGPLRRVAGDATPQCSWCARLQPDWACPNCGGKRLRAPRVGAARTAEELARAFPGVAAINSSGERIEVDVPDHPAIVVATPGGEPSAPTGYAAALLLDVDVVLSRVDLRIHEESLRRWLAATSLVRPGAAGGSVLAVGDPANPVLQSLVRLDPASAAARELADRAETGFPPAAKLVSVRGPHAGLVEFLAAGDFEMAERIGPAGISNDDWSLLLRCRLEDGPRLIEQVKLAMSDRSAHKRAGTLRVQVDPQRME